MAGGVSVTSERSRGWSIHGRGPRGRDSRSDRKMPQPGAAASVKWRLRVLPSAADYAVARAAKVLSHIVESSAVYRQHVNGKVIFARPEIMDHPETIDLAETLRAARAGMSCPGGQDEAVVRAGTLRGVRGCLAVVVRAAAGSACAASLRGWSRDHCGLPRGTPPGGQPVPVSARHWRRPANRESMRCGRLQAGRSCLGLTIIST